MDAAAFEASCRQEGFTDIEARVGAPNFKAQPHTHPFAVRVLVTEGEFTLVREGVPRSYGAGETFHMEAGCNHAEQFGPGGAHFVLGRRHPQP